jgi:hypothetical protein
LLTLLVGVLTAPAAATPATPGFPPHDFVVGGFQFFGAPYSVAAHRTPAGDLAGHIKVDNSVETLTGAPTCMTVVGNDAIVGGTVEGPSGGQINVFLVVQDTGTPADDVPDRAAVIAGPPPTQAFCDLILPTALALTSPVEGSIIVNDAV